MTQPLPFIWTGEAFEPALAAGPPAPHADLRADDEPVACYLNLWNEADACIRSDVRWGKPTGDEIQWAEHNGYDIEHLYPRSAPKMSGNTSLEANDGLEGHSVYDTAHGVRDFEDLTIDNSAFKHLLAHHLPSGEDGLVVGEFVGGKLRAFKVLRKGAVLTDVEIVPGHVLSFHPVTTNSEAKAAFQPTPASRDAVQ